MISTKFMTTKTSLIKRAAVAIIAEKPTLKAQSKTMYSLENAATVVLKRVFRYVMYIIMKQRQPVLLNDVIR
ncbi:hypothetical protein AF332_16840 [Sporosarcina globispora]|uniref:Uncharacterized protein n=1 Tax=Sporosarcina globispora TaxID=1459 RepID=A0A0M0GFT8_SPOGL|nr:hypothetical protein AF332_16840 [Sporosarcina globispora]